MRKTLAIIVLGCLNLGLAYGYRAEHRALQKLQIKTDHFESVIHSYAEIVVEHDNAFWSLEKSTQIFASGWLACLQRKPTEKDICI